LFEQSNDAIFVHSLDGKILDVNNRACELTGYSKTELLALPLPELHPESELENVSEAMEATIKEGSVIFETKFITAKGEILNVVISSGLIDKDVGLVQGIVRDITETKRLQELESRAERLELAGTIAGQVAHDLNNLLAPLMAYPEFIRDELPDNNPALTYLAQIEIASHKIADINQDLLVMGRRGHYNLEVMNLNTVIQHALEALEPYPETLTHDIELDDDLMNILGGGAQLYRMISNLLHNAIDAMPNNGRITVKTENYYFDDVSLIYSLVPKGEYVKLTISDTGCGIPDDIVQKIFDPFFSSKAADRKRGSGLGLSVVDAVIKDHNGYIDLNTKVGEGTSFYIYFPITRELGDNQDSGETCGGSESILIVDDDEIQRDVSAELLKILGYKVNSVEAGDKAIKFLQENQTDLLILDMVMPGGMDGAETYRRILEINPFQKAIILSGFSESDRVLKLQELGAGAFVQKPLTIKSVAAAVRTELERPAKVQA
jgi:PAS domain S-box-containing protein